MRWLSLGPTAWESHSMVRNPLRPASATISHEGLLHTLAAAIHEHWRTRSRDEGWSMQRHIDRPYAELSPADQANNLAAAHRIGQVLAAAHLGMSPTGPSLAPDQIAARVDVAMEAMAEAEHDGWIEQRRSQGWVWGVERDDVLKRHPSMIPYARLSDSEKEKDRNNVRLYPAIVAAAGLHIIDLT